MVPPSAGPNSTVARRQVPPGSAARATRVGSFWRRFSSSRARPCLGAALLLGSGFGVSVLKRKTWWALSCSEGSRAGVAAPPPD